MDEHFLIEDYQTDAGVIETVDASDDEVRAHIILVLCRKDRCIATVAHGLHLAAQRATSSGPHLLAELYCWYMWRQSLLLQVDYLGEPTAGNLQLTHRAQHDSVMQLLGLTDINDVFHAPIPQVCGILPDIASSCHLRHALQTFITVLFHLVQLQTATKALLDELGVPSSDTPEDRPERVYRSSTVAAIVPSRECRNICFHP